MSNILIFVIFQILYFGVNSQICGNGLTGPACQDECGKTFQTPNVKIVGGVPAVPNSWPSLAFIMLNYTFDIKLPGSPNQTLNYVYPCAGTLIDRHTVMTSARCFLTEIDIEYNGKIQFLKLELNKYHSTFESMYSIYLGMHNISSVLANQGANNGTKVSVRKIIKHFAYDQANILNDIALVKLATEVVPNNTIQPACLPTLRSGMYPTRYDVVSYLAGWGSTSLGGNFSNSLNNVNLTIYSPFKCNNVFPGLRKNWYNQICAGAYEGGKSPCDGDVGAPLFVSDVLNGKQKFVVAGITSYGDVCGIPRSPGIFTRVNAYLPWIQRNAGPNA